jgi:hypothetical protein
LGTGELRVIEVLICAGYRDEFLVCASLDDPTLLHHEDKVCVANG